MSAVYLRREESGLEPPVRWLGCAVVTDGEVPASTHKFTVSPGDLAITKCVAGDLLERDHVPEFLDRLGCAADD